MAACLFPYGYPMLGFTSRSCITVIKKQTTMTLKQQREIERLKSAAQFGKDHAAIFNPKSAKAGPSKGQQILSELDLLIAQATTARVMLVGGAKIAGTEEKNALRIALQRELSALKGSIAFIATERKTPALKERFPLLHGNNDEELIVHATAFCDALVELNLESDLLALDHAPDFLEHLRRSIAEFSSADARQTGAIHDKAGATAAIAPILARARVLLRGLNAILKNKFQGDPEKLGAWQSAMHLERSTPKRRDPAPPPAATPTTAPFQPLPPASATEDETPQPNGRRSVV
ncbi:MAG: hypothetical protein JWL90_2291 [Chthoniobacteraceae bacterium]|nr:hypothetical protein [Chthoniobacteraceae bacterium]